MRRLIPLVAALALIAPSCPRDYGPSDYDPDATRPFAPGANEDLVYVAAASAKGDSDYVVAMPRGEVIARIDGPDRRGWVFASPTIAYYPVMRSGNINTIHRIDLRTGSRARIVNDDRPALQFLYESGPEYTALALTGDGRQLLVARVLSSGPQVWIGRYDVKSGALEAERSWPIAAVAANVHLGIAGDNFVMVTAALGSGGKIAQEVRLLDISLRELAALADSDLPTNERCSPRLQPSGGERWATVCAATDGRYASVLLFDSSYRVVSRTPVALATRERVIAWTAQGGSVGILTDRARHVRVGIDGGLTSSWLGEPDGRTFIRSARELAPGVIVAQLNVSAEGEPVGDIATLDFESGRMLRRVASTETALDSLGAGDRLYALLTGAGGQGARLQRLDRDSLQPVGVAATLPQRDDVAVVGLIALTPAH